VCSSHELRRAAGGAPIAALPGACDPNDTDCYSLDILGGYLHADGRSVLVKVRERGCGHRSGVSFLRFEIEPHRD
jgi:hypothetical protein